ncbi:MAG: methionyl-tRNA formyltransferase [Bacteroidetes bacterium HGW-Bacteroidetes-17]|nr:MAG: methionyl-tRNA formyltransferase [Bacteroidetes bacterium HGW-Bacteroidetes-17]
MSVTLFCLGKKAFESLNALSDELISVIDYIIIATDKNIANDYSNEIKTWAISNNINTLPRDSFELSKCISKFYIAIGWRWIIQIKENSNLIVLHDSLLPKYRGFNPLVTALINGDTEIGVTALFGSQEYDKGDIISQEIITIQYPIKIQEAINKISLLYQKILSDLLSDIYNNNPLKASKQDDSKASYSVWRDEEDYKIDWSKSAEDIKRFIDAVGNPYKGASTFLNNMKIRITHAEVVEDILIANRDFGKLIFKKDNYPVIICGKGLLKITEVNSTNNKNLTFENDFRIRLQ